MKFIFLAFKCFLRGPHKLDLVAHIWALGLEFDHVVYKLKQHSFPNLVLKSAAQM